KNFDINAGNSCRGNTPLHEAAAYGQTEMVRLLLGNKGADSNIQNNLGQTPLHSAVVSDRGNQHVIKALLDCPNTYPSIRDNDGKLAIDYVRPYKTAICKLLLEVRC